MALDKPLAGDYFYPTLHEDEYMIDNYFNGSQITVQKLNVLYNADRFLYRRLNRIFELYPDYFSFQVYLTSIGTIGGYSDYKYVEVDFLDLNDMGVYNYYYFNIQWQIKSSNGSTYTGNKVINVLPITQDQLEDVLNIKGSINPFLAIGNSTPALSMATYRNKFYIGVCKDDNHGVTYANFKITPVKITQLG